MILTDCFLQIPCHGQSLQVCLICYHLMLMVQMKSNHVASTEDAEIQAVHAAVAEHAQIDLLHDNSGDTRDNVPLNFKLVCYTGNLERTYEHSVTKCWKCHFCGKYCPNGTTPRPSLVTSWQGHMIVQVHQTKVGL